MVTQREDGHFDRSRWVWVPRVSYGPFVFGSPISETRFVGEREQEMHMGDGESVVDYRSSLGGEVEISFWDGVLIDVAMRDAFVINGINLIGQNLHDREDLIPSKNMKLTPEGTLWCAAYDDLDCMIFANADKTILSVHVGVDPDTVICSGSND